VVVVERAQAEEVDFWGEAGEGGVCVCGEAEAEAEEEGREEEDGMHFLLLLIVGVVVWCDGFYVMVVMSLMFEEASK